MLWLPSIFLSWCTVSICWSEEDVRCKLVFHTSSFEQVEFRIIAKSFSTTPSSWNPLVGHHCHHSLHFVVLTIFSLLGMLKCFFQSMRLVTTTHLVDFVWSLVSSSSHWGDQSYTRTWRRDSHCQWDRPSICPWITNGRSWPDTVWGMHWAMMASEHPYSISQHSSSMLTQEWGRIQSLISWMMYLCWLVVAFSDPN